MRLFTMRQQAFFIASSEKLQVVLAVVDNSDTGIPDFVSEDMKVVTGIT